ncbi:MAG: PP2C family protein-serine/threonine phosphatase [Planctomycetota bacterium]
MDTERLRRLRAVAGEIQKKEDTDRSLHLASVRQQRMLPQQAPELERYEFGLCYEPAAKVSGDFYDFIPVRDGALGIVVADVTGHGVEAGIIMGMAKQAISIYGRQIESPDEVLCLTNEELHRTLDARTFVSLSYAVLDMETHILRFARAGQCRPILINPAWKTVEPQVVNSKGLALGVDKGPRFRQVIELIPIKLEPGDVFFQYTDGLVEATNKEKQQFGEERLMKLLTRYARASAQELVDIVLESLNEFTRTPELEDDLTMLVLKARDTKAITRTARFDGSPVSRKTPPPGGLTPPAPPKKSEDGLPDWMG